MPGHAKRRTQIIVIAASALVLGAILVAKSQGSSPTPTVHPNWAQAPLSTNQPRITKGYVTLSAAPSDRYLLTQGGELFLDVALAGLARSQQARSQPINLALVVDHSGSMGGEKIQRARRAAKAVVEQLREGDRLAIVIYDDVAEMLVPSTPISAESRTRINAAIDTIYDRGSTNLYGGLDLGRRALLERGGEARINRVVLISDGLANVGVSSQEGLSALARQTLLGGVHVTTMGVGLDFNENMMTAIAETGGGHYYFIDNATEMTAIFAKELGTLLATVAKQAELELTLAPGVELLDVYGYTFERRGGAVVVKLPDIYSGLDRKLICKLRVSGGSDGPRTLAKVALHFDDVETGRRESAVARAMVTLTREPERVAAGKDHVVLARAEQASAAQNVTQAMEAFAKGDTAGSRAIIQSQIDSTTRLNQKLKNKALDSMLSNMRAQAAQVQTVAPSSSAGRRLAKSGKFGAYKAAH